MIGFNTYAVLLLAVAFEVVGTSALLACQQFTRPGPSLAVVVCYGAALVLISLTFRTLPMGVVYALWSGIGMVLIVTVGWTIFGQRLDPATLCGIALIAVGVTVINLGPGAALHAR
jgi:small multidrug resistance pump